MMTEVCNNAVVELHLKPLTGEPLNFRTDPDAQLYIAANGGRFERSFFDVTPKIPSKQPVHHQHKREKRREYEHSHFTPLIFTTKGRFNHDHPSV